MAHPGIANVMDRANILVVDDRPDKHVVYSAVLDELDQNLVHVNSGQEALKEVLKREFAVILLDVNMPGIDGLETAALIRRRKRSAHIPIIFITSEYGEDARVAQGYALGAVDFMVSPFAPEILRSKVKVFVELYLLAQYARRQAEEHVALNAERAARAAAERASRRSAFMADASAALGGSLAVMTASRELPRLAIPFLADITALTFRGEDGAEGRTEMAWSDADPAQSLRTESVAAVPYDWWREAIERVIESGNSERFDEVPPRAGSSSAMTASAPLEIPRGTVITSLMILPLSARGRTLGAISLGLGPSGRVFDADAAAIASDLANRAAMALDNALLYRTIRDQDSRKNEFLAMLAHELRNPLTPITNALYIMDQQGTDAGKVAWARQVIGRQTRILGRLVDDLLDVSRITRGKIALKIESLEVADVVAVAVETARPLIDARQHRFTVSIHETPRVNGDAARLAQVLANLLNNSAKYTEPKGGISLTVAGDGTQVVFRVQDNGMGIPADSLSSIFDLFTQADRTLDRSQGGLGIGLTLVRRLVEMQGGSVSVHSGGRDRGSEFTVRMPAALPVEAPSAAPGAPASDPPRRNASRKKRILVVDDNQDAAESMAVLLRLEGHVVHIAYDGQEALDLVPSIRPHAVLLDLGLPGIDGYQVAERVRAMPEGARILLVAISGYAQDTHRKQSTGFDRHFVKPVDPVAITELLSAGRPSEALPLPENVVAFAKKR
ncbi:MAG: response regulator [Betaproteobacteria bacterium]